MQISRKMQAKISNWMILYFHPAFYKQQLEEVTSPAGLWGTEYNVQSSENLYCPLLLILPGGGGLTLFPSYTLFDLQPSKEWDVLSIGTHPFPYLHRKGTDFRIPCSQSKACLVPPSPNVSFLPPTHSACSPTDLCTGLAKLGWCWLICYCTTEAEFGLHRKVQTYFMAHLCPSQASAIHLHWPRAQLGLHLKSPILWASTAGAGSAK